MWIYGNYQWLIGNQPIPNKEYKTILDFFLLKFAFLSFVEISTFPVRSVRQRQTLTKELIDRQDCRNSPLGHMAYPDWLTSALTPPNGFISLSVTETDSLISWLGTSSFKRELDGNVQNAGYAYLLQDTGKWNIGNVFSTPFSLDNFVDDFGKGLKHFHFCDIISHVV